MSTTTQQTQDNEFTLEDSELPEGWLRVKIADVGQLTTGNTPSRAKTTNFGTKYPWVKPSDLDQDQPIVETLESLSEDGASKARLLPSGTVMVSCIGNLGKVGIAGRKLATNQQINSITFTPALVNSRYAYQYCKTIKEWMEMNASATTIPIINKRRFAQAPFLLAPLTEQERIVAKIDRLLARQRLTLNHIRNAQTAGAAFRQAVVAAACAGQLTDDWREHHPPCASIAATLKGIRTRRLGDASASQKEKLLELYEYEEENNSAELPDAWAFVALNKLCAQFQYGTSTKSLSAGQIPVLRMGNIQGGEIDWANLAYTSDREEIRKYSLQPNTVLFNRTNSPELVGKTAIYRGERAAIFAGYLIKIVNFPELDPEYLNLCLNTPYARQFCMQVKTDGVSQSNINAQKLGLFEVPYCSLAEQREIVRRVGALFKLARAIEEHVVAASSLARKLTQAILAKAFRGELVPTEAELARKEGRAYEPASVLMEKIRAERSKRQSASTSRDRRGRLRNLS